MSITTEDIQGAVARAWCYPENESKVMDTDLALAAAAEVQKLLDEEGAKLYLGYATTKHLIDELAARAGVSADDGEEWPFYRTVDS